MEATVMELIPIRKIERVNSSFQAVEDVEVIDDFDFLKTHSKQFIEANTSAVTLKHLKNECIVPVFRDNEVTISHVNFIETVYDAARIIFPREKIDMPEIRVSHIIKGRTPEAINKHVSELLEKDKTIYYERMAFIMEIPGIQENINGNPKPIHWWCQGIQP